MWGPPNPPPDLCWVSPMKSMGLVNIAEHICSAVFTALLEINGKSSAGATTFPFVAVVAQQDGVLGDQTLWTHTYKAIMTNPVDMPEICEMGILF